MDKNYFGTTDTGKIRDNNEDTFIAEKTAGGDLVIACVIDGVGGYSGGEIASAIARKSILHHLNLPNADLPALMRDAMIAADARILNEKQLVKEHEKMACVLTLAVADLQRNLFYYAHVGDTRLYLLRDKSLVKITRDQSFVGFMEDTGRMTEEQAMRHPKRNEINKALGFGANIGQEDYIETGQSPFLPGDILLICSDGLSDMVNKLEITEILNKESSLEEKAAELIAAANEHGGLDNITVVLVKNDKTAQQHEAAKPRVKAAAKSGPAVHTHTAVQKSERSNKGTLWLLIVVCLGLLAVNIYLLWRNHSNEIRQVSSQKLSTIKPPRNAAEKKLQDTLNKMTGNILLLTDSMFKSPVLITEPLQFNRDTVYLIAENGLIIKRDTSFNEIPIDIRPVNKHIMLQNFTFQDFKTAISSQSNALVFKNVRFVNCPNAVQIIYRFPDGRYINGKLQQSTFKSDSLPIPMIQ